MRTCLAGLQYLPPVAYFARALHHGALSVEQCEHYQKRSWRNRTAIQGPHAPLFLTVPLGQGKNEQQPIRSVRIAYERDWVRQHLQAIRTAYGRTAFFSELFPDLERILGSRPALLWELNLELLTWSLDLLSLDIPLSLTNTYDRALAPGVEDLRAGIAAGSQAGDPEALPVYPQVLRTGGSFQPNLSILDVLCHLGAGAGDHVRRYARALYG